MTGILLGDIIKSRSVSSPGVFLNILKEELAEMGQRSIDWEIFMGDSYELRTDKPEDLLTLGIKIKAAIKTVERLDTRIALGIGRVSFRGESISESNGDVFHRSSELLRKLNTEEQTIGLSSPWKDIDKNINLMLRFALRFMDDWTTRMSEAVYHALKNPAYTQEEIGELMKLKQNSVSELLSRARFSDVGILINYFRREIKEAGAKFLPSPVYK